MRGGWMLSLIFVAQIAPFPQLSYFVQWWALGGMILIGHIV
jgi:hypothetical protein